MNTAKSLFSIQIVNDYYTNSNSNIDFDIIPTEDTKRLFERYKLKWFKQDNTYSLLFYNNTKNFVRHLEDNIKDFTFNIYNCNEKIYTYNDIKVGKIYCFNNEYKGSNLHSEEYVSDKDIIEIKEYYHNLFGIIKISPNKIKKENTYSIRIKALSTIWRYYISNKNFLIKNILKIRSNNNNLVFLNYMENGDNLVYTSKDPITLKDKYDHAIFMEYKRIGSEEIIEEILPSPNMYTSYTSDGYFSDIEYTVI